MEEEFICPDDLVCMDIETWESIVDEYDLAMDMSEVSKTSDVQAIIDVTWEMLFLHPWDLIYIGLPMSVLAFYGLSIYAAYRWIQKRFS
jgi:hypothetical protein